MSNKTTLLIARHGNTFGPTDIVRRVGTTDLPLVESGLQQGRKLGLYLRENNLIPDIIYTSQLKRTIQTAEQAQEAMQTNIPCEKLNQFNEIDYGIDENEPEEKVKERLGGKALQEWETQAKVPTGWKVDASEVIKQWQDFASDLIKEHAGKLILVVTSNGIARFAPYLTGDFESFLTQHAIKISTGALCRLEHDLVSNHWSCLQWNIKP